MKYTIRQCKGPYGEPVGPVLGTEKTRQRVEALCRELAAANCGPHHGVYDGTGRLVYVYRCSRPSTTVTPSEYWTVYSMQVADGDLWPAGLCALPDGSPARFAGWSEARDLANQLRMLHGGVYRVYRPNGTYSYQAGDDPPGVEDPHDYSIPVSKKTRPRAVPRWARFPKPS